MKDELFKIIPAIRMLASRNNSVIATYTPSKADTADELLSQDICNDKQSIMELQSDKTDISSLQENFSKWYIVHDKPPAYVAIKGFGSISVSVPSNTNNLLSGRICIVTGAGQGFGAGIAEMLFLKGASIVVADINESIGKQMEKSLNKKESENKALFIRTDVSNSKSVDEMIKETVLQFGGLDIMISNAGILRAGGLDEMTAETFRLMTEVNYAAFFHCAKYASRVMKIQTKVSPGSYCDILQINSKSGLQGSKKNFAYAGGKFGGIGLTQSFALELMPYHIKVNAICPGNFFEGPLWADPKNGLFAQYLKAGKVPGARTVDDVKKYYENLVPAGRGCKVADVVKAILYAIDQKYETGQAIPVTGGQVMLH
jgi:NAD(P)-dependent dehydrogenase (short-subunit alcohol dehydrogenase family)